MSEADGGRWSIQRISNLAGFEALAAEWDGLAKRLSNPTLFQTHAWHRAWLDTLGQRGQAWILAARDESQRVRGIAPLWSDGKSSRGDLRFIGDYLSEYNDFLIDRDHPAAMEVLLHHLVDTRRDWRSLILVHLRDDARVLASLPIEFDAVGLINGTYFFDDAPAMRVDRPEQFDQESRRKSMKRKRNLLRREHEVQSLHLREAHEIGPYLDRFFETHIARWAGTPTPSRFNEPDWRAFHRRMIECLAPHGQVMLSVLMADDRAIAFHLAMLDGESLISFCPCYDPAMARYSPSLVLLQSLFKFSASQGITYFDFAGGSESYKFRYANQTRTIHEFRAFSSRPTGWIDAATQFARIKLRNSGNLKDLIKTAKKRLPDS